MAPSIRDLLGGPDRDRDAVADTTLARRRRQLGDLGIMGAVEPATADSIFRILGDPQNPVQVNVGRSVGDLAEFDEMARQIFFDPEYTALYTALRRNPEMSDLLGGVTPVDETLAHEMGHQATVREDRELVSGDPDVQGFMNLFFSKYEDLPPEKQHDLKAAYSGGGWDEPSDYRPRGTDRHEVLADALERGFSLARRADPSDPSVMRDEVTAMEEELPGTREAFNFWMRRLMQEFPNEDPR